jgi:hypothetical protein
MVVVAVLVMIILLKVVVAVVILVMEMLVVVSVRNSGLDRIVSNSPHQQTTTSPTHIVLLHLGCRLKMRFIVHSSFALQ